MGMLEQQLVSHQVDGISFSLYSAEEIRSLSVMQVTNPNVFDVLGHPASGGLYDPALGAFEKDDVCTVCGQTNAFCPGHLGHIELPLPSYNPFLYKTLYQLLKVTCFYCKRLLMPLGRLLLLERQMDLLDAGLISLASNLEDYYNSLLADQGVENISLEDMSLNFDTYIKQFSNSNEDGEKPIVKGTVEFHQTLLREFLSGTYCTNRCPHCKRKKRNLKSEFSCRFFFGDNINKKTKMTTNRSIPTSSLVDDDDDFEEEEIEEENNAKEKERDIELHQQMCLTPVDTRRHLQDVWKTDGKVIKCLMGVFDLKGLSQECPTDIFFIDVLPVVPSRFRPCAKMNGLLMENPQTRNLSRCLANCVTIINILSAMKEPETYTRTDTSTSEKRPKTGIESVRGDTLSIKLQNAWLLLQTAINCVVDQNLDKLSTDKQPGIKQLLEKKQGLFRMHMMGKRVNFAARSVISPDPYISTNEIGIPLVFAKKLTFPEPATAWNFHSLKQAIINGPKVHPGAVAVEYENGNTVLLNSKDVTQREAIAKQLLTPGVNTRANGPNKKVYRHLRNGDVLLLNRQPTLHRPSIQAHKARVLPGEKTLRLHYANCKAYNADFDGDEMNAHFPQNELARAEAYNLMSTDFQYLVPKDGTPLAGLIQDYMVSGVMLTLRGSTFTREQYQQLVYSALNDHKGRIQLLPPAMYKPYRLWSGKQVFSSVLINIIPKDQALLNMKGQSKISAKNFINGPCRPCSVHKLPIDGEGMSENEVIIRQGELLVGVLDKGHYGNTPYGLVHCCYELYGGAIAGRLLTSIARLFTKNLQWRGFTLGVEDILVTKTADKARRKVMKAGSKGDDVAVKALNVSEDISKDALRNRLQEAHFNKDPGDMKDLDLSMKGKTDEIQNDIVKVTMPQGLEKQFPLNNLQLMVQSGAKGSSVNCMQISCLLGQIELEGRRPPLMLSGQSLPSFLAYDTAPRAGGFVDGRFLTGIRPQEYYFHCMAGREGLVDTAVKTSRSGYLQRCLIKHIEGLTVNYDLSVRDSDGSIVQYGEDSLDIAKTQFLNTKQFPFLISNQEATKYEEKYNDLRGKINLTSADHLWKKVKKWRKKKKCNRISPFLRFCQKKWVDIQNSSSDQETKAGRNEPSSLACEMWENIESKDKYLKYGSPAEEPVACQLQPDRYFAALSEAFEQLIDNYMSNVHEKMLCEDGEEGNNEGNMSRSNFRKMMSLKYLQSLVQPGEAVGLLAAQSIGEPSTQMTLNTFHFAGRGEMNVTLGIPRLREILMVASSNIKTPSMAIPLLPSPNVDKHAKLLKRQFNCVYLSQVLESVDVTERVVIGEPGLRSLGGGRHYKIRFNFLPHNVYRSEFLVTPFSVLQFMEKKFLRHLDQNIKSRMLVLNKCSLVKVAKVREKKAEQVNETFAGDGDNDVSDDEQHDGDSTAVKQRGRHAGEQEYEGEEEERQEIGDDEDSDIEDSDEDEDKALTYGAEAEENVVTGGKKIKEKEMDPRRINTVLCLSNNLHAYSYDVKHSLWCEVTYQFPLDGSKLDMTSLIETVAKKTVVYETSGVKRCFLSESNAPGEEGTVHVKTEGVNLMEVYKYDQILDLNKLYTNDIHALSHTYGIEAACRAIIKEIRDVFAGYGIYVDYRHLSLIADYMTFEGTYKAFNRTAIDSNASPLQKMTFETTMNFLTKATIMGARDTLSSPSARLVAGRLVLGGTGCFQLLPPL